MQKLLILRLLHMGRLTSHFKGAPKKMESPTPPCGRAGLSISYLLKTSLKVLFRSSPELPP
ncbi:MAG: hypothetical protein WAX89_00290, partial [Alphaproteobacteria bacterium]